MLIVLLFVCEMEIYVWLFTFIMLILHYIADGKIYYSS